MGRRCGHGDLLLGLLRLVEQYVNVGTEVVVDTVGTHLRLIDVPRQMLIRLLTAMLCK